MFLETILHLPRTIAYALIKIYRILGSEDKGKNEEYLKFSLSKRMAEFTKLF